MHSSLVTNITRQLQRCSTPLPRISSRTRRPYDVFINHRGVDTKRTVAGLLYQSLARFNIQPFLDSESMKPGDKLFDKINKGIRECKVGVAVFSPNYCDSYFCLHELALIMECKKKVIPIFCDIKPSELLVWNNGGCSNPEIRRFRWALEEARYTVGITFDSTTGNWPDLVNKTTDIIIKSLMEVQEEEQQQHQPPPQQQEHQQNAVVIY